jgi:outer membrane protein TolC
MRGAIKMKRFAIPLTVISIFFAKEAWSSDAASLDRFLDMVKSNAMIISETKALESAHFSAMASVSDQRTSFGSTVSGYLTGQSGGEESDTGGFEIRLGVTQPIDVSGKFGLRERREIISLELRRANLENTVNSLLAEAETAYWSAVIAGENVSLQRDVLRRRTENKRITDEKYRMKTVPRLDTIRAESLVIAAEALVAQAETERLDMLALMASLAGQETEPTEMSAAPPSNLGPLAESGASIDRRPDMKAGKLAVELAVIEKELAAIENAPAMEASVSWVPFSAPSQSSGVQK